MKERTNNNKHGVSQSYIGGMRVPLYHMVFHAFPSFLQITNLEKNVQNLKIQLAGAHGNHKEAMDQVIHVHLDAGVCVLLKSDL